MKNRTVPRLIAAALFCVSLIGAFLTPAGAADKSFSDSIKKYDFSHPDGNNLTLTGLEVASVYLEKYSEEFTEAERRFIAEHEVFTVTYSDAVTTEHLSLDYDSVSDTLRIKASSYSYGEGERALSWYPVSANVGGEELILTNGEATVSGVSADGKGVTVTYRADIVITADDVGKVVNLYHDTAKYLSDSASYGSRLELFEEYLIAKRIYEDAFAVYEKYLYEYEIYLEELGLYEQYEERLAAYREDYRKYSDYLAAVEQYESDCIAYENYLEDKALIKEQLSALELLKVPMTDGRTVYSAVMGPLVDQVLENETALVDALGADKAVIEQAGDSTELLRTLMKGYFLETDEKGKYLYYLNNYDTLTKTVNDLLDSLNKLYSYRKVRATLIADGKDKKYIILVAQLALVANALTDSTLTDYDGNVAYGDNWKIEGKTIKAILENKTYHTDMNRATPLEKGYPEEMTEPVLPNEVKMPSPPERVDEPIPPREIAHPGEAPVEVAEPLFPTVPNAFVGAILGVISESTAEQLRLAYDYGECEKHRSPTEDYLFNPEAKVTRTVGKPSVTVEFRNADGSPIESHTVEQGGRVIFEGEQPYREEDEYNSYEFRGWQTADGKLVDHRIAEESTVLYPYFEKAPKYYDITWIVDGNTVTERVVSDIIPECPLPTVKPETLGYYYVFSGWDKPLEPVGRDVTYTAVFDKLHVVAYTGGGATLFDDGETVICDARNATHLDTEPIPLTMLLERIAGKRALTLRTVRGDFEFSFTDTLLMKREGVEGVFVDVGQGGSVSNNFELRLVGADDLTEGIYCSASLYHNVSDIAVAKLSRKENGKNELVKCTLTESLVTFDMQLDVRYTLAPVYGIRTIADSGTTLTVSNENPEPGELVRVGIGVGAGYKLRSVEIIDLRTGEQIPLVNGSFRMPRSDVEIRSHGVIKTYTVTFVSDGKVISTVVYKHGETLKVPTAPKREADDKYTYEFLGWAPGILTEVTEDMTYIALYEKTEIPPKIDDGGIKLSDSVKHLIAAVGAVITVLIVGVIPCIILSCVLSRKHKRRVNLSKSDKKTP